MNLVNQLTSENVPAIIFLDNYPFEGALISMLSQIIRQKFLKYFNDRHHMLLPSSSVVPHNDPTLLFNNAGMNQFKDVFLGESQRDYKRATTAQKCIRVGGKHNDLENVGHTSRHLTFFEMLGNFSFGDYFKKEAITFAWEVALNVFEFEPEKLWISVFREDDEAYELWKQIIPSHRIVRLDEKDNFWAMGETGPCGPCSELYYDRGSRYGSAASLLHDSEGERFLEFWNLVFMQFNRSSEGVISSLPQQSIDTGSGLERVVLLKQGVESVFQTDILNALIQEIAHVSGNSYESSHPLKSAPFHVIADHIRSLSFAIADGAQPSNIERGYVLRKLVRRAVRYGRQLGIQKPFLGKLLPSLVQLMGDDYPELKKSQDRIEEILLTEEEAFLRTLTRGGNILSSVISQAQQRMPAQISGQEAFKLKDTYGFPLEEILLLAKDSHLTVNLETYQLLEEAAKEKSKSAHQQEASSFKEEIYKTLSETLSPSLFVGYDHVEGQSQIEAIIMKGALVSQIKAGEEGVIILNQTPFYKEMGGQIGDTGALFHPSGSLTVVATQAAPMGLIAHHVVCEQGVLKAQEVVTAAIDISRRKAIQNAHTATHLLHFALTQLLGSHLKQAGSLVEPERVRFDFNHHKPLAQEEILQIEACVNEKIRQNHPVHIYEILYEEAQKKPEIKQFFGDKYSSLVRVVDIGFSQELCGGTHTESTGTIGYFRITKESSIAAGVRRIEAVIGNSADAWVKACHLDLEHKIEAQAAEIKTLLQQIKTTRKLILKEMAKELIQKKIATQATSLVISQVDIEPSELTELAGFVADLLPSSGVVLGVKLPEKCQVILKLSADLVKQGWNASSLLKNELRIIEGSGGGKPDLAQAGGKLAEKLPELLTHLTKKLCELS
ncbi:MAG: alanine--tRNA ligase [Candidatus Rhabdochlamydia sp.]